MKVTKTAFDGLVILEPSIFVDNRGQFSESYNKKALSGAGIDVDFVQDNQSLSFQNVIRGLHYQKSPHAQAKLVQVTDGVILDVVVDLRFGSPTFGKVFSIELSGTNNRQVFIPPGFAHGFSVLGQRAMVLYKVDKYYDAGSESGIRFDDPDLAIDWKIDTSRAIISEKDRALPLMVDCKPYLKA